MAEQISYLIVGNGIAGVTAAETLRAEAPGASIGIVADDPYPVYYRPALKDYLAGRVGEDRLWARPMHFYQQRKIHFLRERVVAIQAQEHAVQLQGGKRIGYGQLLLAHGASPARLTCPGSELQGVSTLRTVADYQAILARLPNVRHVVIVGSGTLALETAESLRARGFEVTHLLRRRTIWSEVLDTTASDLVLQQELRAGVDVQLETEIVEITGSRGEVNGVVTNQGKRIRCELVLVAIGIEPNVDFVRASNIFCGRGIQVDKTMRTSSPDVYAAGDVLESRGSREGRMRVVGQWYPAVQQGRAAAYNMLGIADNKHPFDTSTFYNATFLYGLDFASVGITNQLGYQELIAEPKPRSYCKVLLQDGIPVGILSLGERGQALAFKRAIDERVNLSSIAGRLFDEDFKLNDWLDVQGVPPLRLGVHKAGDTAMRLAVTKRKAVEVMGVMGVMGVIEEAEKTRPLAERETVLNGSSQMEDRHTQHIAQSFVNAAEALLVHISESGSSLRIGETSVERGGAILIGRQPGVDLLINEGSVSRQHAEIRSVQGRYELRDLGSLNGTFINDNRVEPNKPYVLKPNDALRIGNSVKFKFLLRLSDVAARGGSIDVDTDPLPARTTDFLNDGPAPARVPAAQEEETALKLTGRLSALQSISQVGKSIPTAMIEALKETPGLVVMPEKGAAENGQPRIVLLQTGKRVTVGREEGNDVILSDMDVSRRHAEIFPAPNGIGVYIRDNNSSNGVWINKSKIDRPYRLSHGDRIKLGNTLIFFVDLQSGRELTTRLSAVPVPSTPPQASRQEPGGQRPGRAPVPVEAAARTEQPARVPGAPTGKDGKGQTKGAQVQMKICPQCRLPNMPVARFCGRCSTPL